VHIWTKFVEEHVRMIDIFVPFVAPYNTLYVGFGTLSGWIMMLVMWTGLARAKFIGRGRPWMWRSIHAISYLMWPIALVHGLAAGRAAATWVIVSYVVCVLLVLVGLAVRLSVSLNRRKDFASTSAGSMKPVGSLVPTQSPVLKKKPSRRAEPERAAAPEPWRPAAAPQSSAMPVSGAPLDPAPYARYMEEEPRGRRYAEETQVAMPRPRRERYDEETRAMSRRARELDGPPSGGGRRRAMEAEYHEAPRGSAATDAWSSGRRGEPGPLRGRQYADEEDYAPRGRRRAVEEEYEDHGRYAGDDLPPQRGYPDARTTGEFRMGGGYGGWSEDPRPRRSPRYAEDDEPAPRARRHSGGDRADSGRHSRSEFVDLAAPADPWGGPDDPNYMEPDETPTLVDMASRRARRQERQDAVRPAGRGARRGAGRSAGAGAAGDLDDPGYWRQLRGEAQ
jgi:hypothetical protein